MLYLQKLFASLFDVNNVNNHVIGEKYNESYLDMAAE